jgi:predicted signal transduction protein with EAL and GGDEF domain
LDRALQQADEALYRAKHAGRDKAVVFGSEPDGNTPFRTRKRA